MAPEVGQALDHDQVLLIVLVKVHGHSPIGIFSRFFMLKCRKGEEESLLKALEPEVVLEVQERLGLFKLEPDQTAVFEGGFGGVLGECLLYISDEELLAHLPAVIRRLFTLEIWAAQPSVELTASPSQAMQSLGREGLHRARCLFLFLLWLFFHTRRIPDDLGVGLGDAGQEGDLVGAQALGGQLEEGQLVELAHPLQELAGFHAVQATEHDVVLAPWLYLVLTMYNKGVKHT